MEPVGLSELRGSEKVKKFNFVIAPAALADCELICTDDLSYQSLARTIEEMYGGAGNRMK